MGLGDYEKNIIRFVAENNIREAKKWALLAVEADKTIKNRSFINHYKNILTAEGSGMIELPGNLKDI